MPEKSVNTATRELVFSRANYLCEYCLSPLAFCIQPFVVEHIIPISKGGNSHPDNLACSCGGCNGHKYNKMEAIDPADNKTATLFHPRQQDWAIHFGWSADFIQIIGLTDIGRATVAALHLNRSGVQNIRRLLVFAGKHPPYMGK